MESAENTDEGDSDPETPLKEGEDIVDGGVFNKAASNDLADI
jgi:hypothetical protein